MSDTSCDRVFVIREDFFTFFKLKAEALIGSGTFGEVYLATRFQNKEQKIAVKIFKSHSRKDIHFTREVNILLKLNHRQVIKLIMAVKCPNYSAFVMPYYKNGSLSVHLNTLSHQQLAKYFCQLVIVLNYLYSERICHSDIKPGNILLDDKDNAVLSDFDLSFHVPPGSDVISIEGIGGTPTFMAPESFISKTLDPFKVDIYSLGAVLWCMLFRREPDVIINYLEETTTKEEVADKYR